MNVPARKYGELLIRYLRPQKLRVYLLMGLIFGSIGLQLANPQVLRYFIDSATGGGALSGLTTAALLFLGLALFNQVLTVAATYVGENVGWTATNMLRVDLTLHCLKLDMGFHKARTPGEMIERIDGDVNALSKFFSQFVIQVLGNLLLLAGVLVMLMREDWRIGLALTVFACLSVFVLNKSRNIAVPAMTAERQASANLFGFLEERLAGLPDIRANGTGGHVMFGMYGVMRDLYRTGRKAWQMDAVLWLITLTLFTLGYVIAFTVGAYLFGAGAITLGTMYLFFQYTEMLRQPLDQLTEQLKDLQKATAGIGRVQELYSTQATLVDGPGVTFPSGPLSVDFADVSFGYGDEEMVLNDITFRLEAGKVLGLLGRTGSGKTTITRLLFRLYDPERGVIRLGGHEIRNAKLGDLRQSIGMVTQDVQLFQATVRDNLTLFDRTIPDDLIMQVIRDLGLGNWYHSLQDGLDTELGPGGGGLSAGEAQLLAFTRVFLENPGLVILDEASSRLDPATEQLIERAVDKLMKNRTVIIIAHRLATVERADEIMILDEGRVVEHGQRASLKEDTDSRFSHLLRAGLEEVLV
ncbi:MAG TPA: ABC transporter ATP-binding protein [Chloroflexia bacterium]|nr:ABC transporter ATP-binding protein [Chloroflexia bacterium]